jgi:Amt family ammonium transporter
LHGVIGTWGGIAAGIFGQPLFGGMGGVTFISQLGGSLLAVGYALLNGFIIYGLISKVLGIRLTPEQEFAGPDLSIHSINAYPEEHVK